MGKITKHVLSSFLRNNCERQLFLEIAKDQPEWFSHEPELTITERLKISAKLVTELGKEYEQKIYSHLRKYHGTHANSDKKDLVQKTKLDYKLLLQIYDDYNKDKKRDIILLESEFRPPKSLLEFIFPKTQITHEFPTQYSKQRPDILFIGNNNLLNESPTKPLFELLPNSKIRKIPKIELNTRIGIRIIDIKNTQTEHVGKTHFIEILLYMNALAYFLDEFNLLNKFFISLDNNGIFPSFTDDELVEIYNNSIPSNLINNVISMEYDEFKQIFILIVDKIRSFWEHRPWDINDTENLMPRIQPLCGYCDYLDDCKKRLGVFENSDPKDWDPKVMPYTSQTIAAQLSQLGFKNVKDVHENLKNIHIGRIPQPIYPELPLISLKTLSYMKNDVIFASENNLKVVSLPPFSPVSLTFCAENDTANNRVFVVGLNLTISAPSNTPYRFQLDNWWHVWSEALADYKSQKGKVKEYDITSLKEELDSIIPREIPNFTVKEFLLSLDELKYLKIMLPGTKTKTKTKTKEYKKSLVYAQIPIFNEDMYEEDELKFTIKVVKTFHNLINIANVIETYIYTDSEWEGYYYRPTMAIYYWDAEQIKNLQDLIERHLPSLIDNPEISKKILLLISWFAPSESEVPHPYQHKKIFNLRNFAETALGIPTIINYTWHETAQLLLKSGFNFSKIYWMEHFNYMNFQNWHFYLKYLKDNNLDKAQERKKGINSQAIRKAVTLESLRRHFQIEGKNLISQTSSPIQSLKYVSLTKKGFDFHPIAQVWYLYSLLNGTLDEFEAEYIRNIYPEYSIGKLNAGKVSNLVQTPLKEDITKFDYKFELRGLSSNMKISEGDHVLLLPLDMRDIKLARGIKPQFTIEIARMEWSEIIQGYFVSSETTNNDFYDNYCKSMTFRKRIPLPREKVKWYLYPDSFDAWSSKLWNEKRTGLLQNLNFGNSWLGERLSYLWKIRSNPKMTFPINKVFHSSEIYLYAPQFLQVKSSLYSNTNTSIFPPPDKSQQRSILNCMNSIISNVRGPPGTGKTQTIAALIDEFITTYSNKHSRKSIKILVMAFSYAAIRVVIDKVRKSKDNKGNLTLAAKSQHIFIHSEYQDEIENVKNVPDIDDVIRRGQTWLWNGRTKTITEKKPLDEKLKGNSIIYTNSHQLYFLMKDKRVESNFYFDLIVIDEASQVPTVQILSAYQFLGPQTFTLDIDKTFDLNHSNKENIINSLESLRLQTPHINGNLFEFTKVVVVGDNNQLPPVQPIKPPKKLESVLESLFSYYEKHGISTTQLMTNYRSHQDIVEFTKVFGFYDGLATFKGNISKTINEIGKFNNITVPWVKEVLNPKKVVSCMIHLREFELSVSAFEAKIVSEIVLGFYEMINPRTQEDEIKFWEEQVGVVSPHNAQGRIIIQNIYDILNNPEIKHRDVPKTTLNPNKLMNLIKSSVYSVEKFQGSDREMIISSIGISDQDQISMEEEFIYDLNRFNVLTSRAKKKLIMICSRNYLDYIPEEKEMILKASKSRNYCYRFCNREKVLFPKNERNSIESVYFRWYSKKSKEIPPFSTFSLRYQLKNNTAQVIYSNTKVIQKMLKNCNNDYLVSDLDENVDEIELEIPKDKIGELSKKIALPHKLLNTSIILEKEKKSLTKENFGHKVKKINLTQEELTQHKEEIKKKVEKGHKFDFGKYHDDLY